MGHEAFDDIAKHAWDQSENPITRAALQAAYKAEEARKLEEVRRKKLSDPGFAPVMVESAELTVFLDSVSGWIGEEEKFRSQTRSLAGEDNLPDAKKALRKFQEASKRFAGKTHAICLVSGLEILALESLAIEPSAGQETAGMDEFIKHVTAVNTLEDLSKNYINSPIRLRTDTRFGGIKNVAGRIKRGFQKRKE